MSTYVGPMLVSFQLLAHGINDGLGAILEIDEMDAKLIQSCITETAGVFLKIMEERPDHVFVKVIVGKKVVDEQRYHFIWFDDETFGLKTEDGVMKSDIFSMNEDEDDQAEQVEEKEKSLLAQIDKALDTKDRAEFERLTNLLNQLRKVFEV